MQWPAHFPKNCPPEDANNKPIKVYMLVHSPIVAEDFLSLKLRKPENTYTSIEIECQACGLSTFSNINHIKRVQNRVRRLRKRALAIGYLNANTGVYKPTPSQFGNSHFTWWVPEKLKPWKFFELLEL